MNSLEYKFDAVERLASGTKIDRFLNNPYKYIFAFGVRKLIYPFSKKGVLRTSKLFFGRRISILLPAGSDVYILGGKSHDSEIRLTKFIFKNLQDGDMFLDVGAHFGYFTLLASELVGTKGKVISLEPSVSSFKLLANNTKEIENITSLNLAASNTNESLTFYEFPIKFSEYNSFNVDQFKMEKWFKYNKPKPHSVKCTTLAELISYYKARPKIIKIDVEGAELKVISGLNNLLQTGNFILVMEYLTSQRSNDEHKKAKMLLENKGFKCHVITATGELSRMDTIDKYLEEKMLDSDNIVFTK